MTPFDVVLVPFPFSDLSAVKQRPCLVLASFTPRSLPMHCIVAMITSQTKGLTFPGDVFIEKWESAGLPKASLVRLAKVVTLDASMIRKKVGTLNKADRVSTITSFRQIFRTIAVAR